MNKHTIQDLYQMQSLSLDAKIRMTKARIKGWIDEFGEDGVYVSFSGGKDSTVLLDIVREDYPNVKAMFVDVPTQFPELRKFVEKFDNVDIIRPKMNFFEVCKKYGFPLISKEVSECVEGARKYLTSLIESETVLTDRQTDRIPYRYWYERVTGTGKYLKKVNTPNSLERYDTRAKMSPSRGGHDNKYRKLRGIGEYSKRTYEEQDGWKQSTFSDYIGNAHERQERTDKGEYP